MKPSNVWKENKKNRSHTSCVSKHVHTPASFNVKMKQQNMVLKHTAKGLVSPAIKYSQK